MSVSIAHQETGSGLSPRLLITQGGGNGVCTTISLTTRAVLTTDTATLPVGCLNSTAKINGATLQYLVGLTDAGGGSVQSGTATLDGMKIDVVTTDGSTRTLTLASPAPAVNAAATVDSVTLSIAHQETGSSVSPRIVITPGGQAACTAVSLPTRAAMTTDTVTLPGGCSLTSAARVNGATFQYQANLTDNAASQSGVARVDAVRMTVVSTNTTSRGVTLSSIDGSALPSGVTPESVVLSVAHQETGSGLNPRVVITQGGGNGVCSTISLTTRASLTTDAPTLPSGCLNSAAKINGASIQYVVNLTDNGSAQSGVATLDGMRIDWLSTNTTNRTLTLSSSSPTVPAGTFDSVTVSIAHQETGSGVSPTLVITPGGGSACTAVALTPRTAMTTDTVAVPAGCLDTIAKVNGATYQYQAHLTANGTNQNGVARVDGVRVVTIATDTTPRSVTLSALAPTVTGTVDTVSLSVAHQETGSGLSPRIVVTPGGAAACTAVSLTTRAALTTDVVTLPAGCLNTAAKVNGATVQYLVNLTANGSAQSGVATLDGARLDVTATDTTTRTLTLSNPAPTVPAGSTFDTVSMTIAHQETVSGANPRLVITPGGGSACTAVALTTRTSLTTDTVAIPSGCLNTAAKVNGATFQYQVNLTDTGAAPEHHRPGRRRADDSGHHQRRQPRGDVVVDRWFGAPVGRDAGVGGVVGGASGDGFGSESACGDHPGWWERCVLDDLSDDACVVDDGHADVAVGVFELCGEDQRRVDPVRGEPDRQWFGAEWGGDARRDADRLVVDEHDQPHPHPLEPDSRRADRSGNGDRQRVARDRAPGDGFGHEPDPRHHARWIGGVRCDRADAAGDAHHRHDRRERVPEHAGEDQRGNDPVPGSPDRERHCPERRGQPRRCRDHRAVHQRGIEDPEPHELRGSGAGGEHDHERHAEGRARRVDRCDRPGRAHARWSLRLRGDPGHRERDVDDRHDRRDVVPEHSGQGQRGFVPVQRQPARRREREREPRRRDAHRRPPAGTRSGPGARLPPPNRYPASYPADPTKQNESKPACDETKPGVQFIFGGDSRVYQPDGTVELCAGPSPGVPGQNGYTAQRIAVYGVAPTPSMTPTGVVDAAGVWGPTPTDGLTIGEAPSLKTATLSGPTGPALADAGNRGDEQPDGRRRRLGEQEQRAERRRLDERVVHVELFEAHREHHALRLPDHPGDRAADGGNGHSEEPGEHHDERERAAPGARRLRHPALLGDGHHVDLDIEPADDHPAVDLPEHRGQGQRRATPTGRHPDELVGEPAVLPHRDVAERHLQHRGNDRAQRVHRHDHPRAG